MGAPCECSGQRTVQEHHGSKGAPRSPTKGGNTMGCLRGPGAKGGVKKNRVRCKCERGCITISQSGPCKGDTNL